MLIEIMYNAISSVNLYDMGSYYCAIFELGGYIDFDTYEQATNKLYRMGYRF